MKLFRKHPSCVFTYNKVAGSSVLLHESDKYFFLMQRFLLLLNHVLNDLLHHVISFVRLRHWALRPLLLIKVCVTTFSRRWAFYGWCWLILPPCTLSWWFWGAAKVPTFLDLAPCYSMSVYEISIGVDIGLSTRHSRRAIQAIYSFNSGTNDNLFDLFGDNASFVSRNTLEQWIFD